MKDSAGPLKNVVRFGPSVIVLFFVVGYYSGEIAIKYKPQFNLVSTQSVESVQILRTFNKGVLISNERGFVSFRSWESFERIEKITASTAFPGLLKLLHNPNKNSFE
jgi:hypothetical protein